MKLSEAIFLGSKLSVQGFRVTVSADGSRCAFGAAMEATGCDEKNIPELWPWVGFQSATCPVCEARDVAACIIASHLNDYHRWTREQIADWVATVEPPEPHQLPPIPAEEGCFQESLK